MGLVTKANNQRLFTEGFQPEITGRGAELTTAIINQFNEFHSKSYWDDDEIERLLIRQKEFELDNHEWFKADVPIFSPSSASKCERELFFKLIRSKKDAQGMFPYQQRWVNNGSAIHARTQRDLLYMEKKLKDPAFTVLKTHFGLPNWEKAGAEIRHYDWNGEKFACAGMMDGKLKYEADGSTIGFEFKTKSTTIATVGNYKMKDAQDGHKTQCTAYSLIFPITEYIIFYESVAKDGWMKGETAKSDIRAFYHKVETTAQEIMLDKFARVTKAVRDEEMPEMDTTKCIFCPYKTLCKGGVV